MTPHTSGTPRPTRPPTHPPTWFGAPAATAGQDVAAAAAAAGNSSPSYPDAAAVFNQAFAVSG